MKVLAFDLATSTGWAIVEDRNGEPAVVESGVQRFDRRRGESTGLMYLRFRKWAYDIVESFRRLSGAEGVVAYERSHMRGGASTELALALQTRVQEAAAAHGIETVPVHSASLRSFVLSKLPKKTRAGKAASVELATRVLGRDPETDDEADAVNLATMVCGEIGVVEPPKPKIFSDILGDFYVLFPDPDESDEEFVKRVRRFIVRKTSGGASLFADWTRTPVYCGPIPREEEGDGED